MRQLFFLISVLLVQGMAMAGNKIKGVVFDDSDGKGLVAATVVLHGEGGFQLRGVTTDADGRFVLEGVANGSYLLRFSYIGYEEQTLALTNLSKDVDLGEVRMTPATETLDEVVVRGDAVTRKIDRRMVLPTDEQKKAATNGISLLQYLQLPNLSVNVFDKTVQTHFGEAVQLRINGVEATKEEVAALRPSEVQRIEYHDQPGLRYGGAAAVLDYIVKRKERGGNVTASLDNGVQTLGLGNYLLAGKYHRGKSSVNGTVQWTHRDLEWTRKNTETFRYPDRTVANEEIGLPTRIKYDYLTANLNYTWADADRRLLNVAFRNTLHDSPYSISDRNSILHQEGKTYTVTDREDACTFIPSLDVYYQLNFSGDRHLYLDVVGTWLSSSSLRTYSLTEAGGDPLVIRSETDGDKKSLIGEAIYEQPLAGGKLTAGMKHTQSYLSNVYGGDAESKVGMNTAESYLFAEYRKEVGRVGYTLGVGAMRTYHRQAEVSRQKLIFRPTLTLSYRPTEQIFLRYNAYLSGYAPSLSALNDVTQSMDAYQVRRGNPDLRSVTFFTQSLSGGWRSGRLNLELSGRYSYDDRPIMEETRYEDGLFVRSYANQRGFHRFNLQGSFQWFPIREHLSVSLYPFYNRYISLGNAYTHTHSNWGVRASVSGMYKRWSFLAEMNTSYHDLWGETINKGEAIHYIAVGYNFGRWSLQTMMINPFTDDYKMEVVDLSVLASGRRLAYSKDFTRVVRLNVSFNLDFGKQRADTRKRIQNADTDTGVLSGSR